MSPPSRYLAHLLEEVVEMTMKPLLQLKFGLTFKGPYHLPHASKLWAHRLPYLPLTAAYPQAPS